MSGCDLKIRSCDRSSTASVLWTLLKCEAFLIKAPHFKAPPRGLRLTSTVPILWEEAFALRDVLILSSHKKKKPLFWDLANCLIWTQKKMTLLRRLPLFMSSSDSTKTLLEKQNSLKTLSPHSYLQYSGKLPTACANSSSGVCVW